MTSSKTRSGLTPYLIRPLLENERKANSHSSEPSSNYFFVSEVRYFFRFEKGSLVEVATTLVVVSLNT